MKAIMNKNYRLGICHAAQKRCLPKWMPPTQIYAKRSTKTFTNPATACSPAAMSDKKFVT
jgi:hypothetical protein